MKAKTIKAVLRKKVDAWLATIEDEELRDLAAKNVIVTGGCIASMLLREPVNDIDVYFRTYETAFKVAQHYVRRFQVECPPVGRNGIPCKIYIAGDGGHEIVAPEATPGRIKIVCKSVGIASEEDEEGPAQPYQYFEGRPPAEAGDYVSEVMDDPGAILDRLDDVKETIAEDDAKPKYRPVFLSSNAITLANQVQLIVRFYGEPDEIHTNYDFVHCTNYYDAGNDKLVLRPDALEALLTKELRYIGSKYPVCSIIRVRKFVARQWTINAGQILKMAMQVSQLDLTNPAVLEDQLTGVDVAYFAQVISLLREKDPEKVNYAYLVEIIDRMF